MRQRTTLFHSNEDAIDPAAIVVNGQSITGPELRAVREDRFTFGLDELPYEVQQLLRDIPELHLKWSTPSAYDTLHSGPWTSRLPPGLHVFYTPQEAPEGGRLSDPICTYLHNFVPYENCSESLVSEQSRPCRALWLMMDQDHFSRLPNDRFSHSTAYQAYLPLDIDGLGDFAKYVQKYLCTDFAGECDDLREAQSLDLSYDTISHVLKINVLWGLDTQPLNIAGHSNDRVEVGLLTPNYPEHLENEEIGVAGLLTVLGEDKKPSAVMFSFPTRHKAAGASFTSKFASPLGLHPALQLQFSSSKPPMDDTFCSLHAYLTLQNAIFADKYQLEDPLFLSSKNITALRYISQPVDLEAPSYVMKLWGSSVLLELKPPPTGQEFTAEIPLHFRYQVPRAGGKESIQVPYPTVFWACAAEEGTKFPNNPFDRVNLGYDGLFGPRTLFWHLDPAPQDDNLFLRASVPVLDLGKSRSVSTLTGAAVLLGVAWVTWKLLSVFGRTGHGPSSKLSTEKKSQ